MAIMMLDTHHPDSEANIEHPRASCRHPIQERKKGEEWKRE